MHIVVADDIPASALALLRAEGWSVDARSGRTPDQLKIDLADADALVVRSATRVTPDVIAAAPKLRAIARAGTGVDNVHVETATTRNIVVMNAPGANSISVAELALAQILALARKLPDADASMKQGVWDKKSFMGEEIRGKVLGLAGLGRIGPRQPGHTQRPAQEGTHCQPPVRPGDHRSGQCVELFGIHGAPPADETKRPVATDRPRPTTRGIDRPRPRADSARERRRAHP